METVIIALLAGYPVMGAAIAVLYRDLRKSQNERIKSQDEHDRVLNEFKTLLKNKNRR